MAQEHSIIRINVLSVCISILLLLAAISQCNARSFRDGSNTDWFRKSSLRSDPPAESGRWFRYTGNRNWFGRTSFHRDVQDLDNIMRRLERAKQALIEEGEQIDNTIITEDVYNGGDVTIDEEHPWRMRINRRYM